MTTDEYQRLVEFLSRQFTEIDRRFSAVDQQFVVIDRRFAGLESRFEARFEGIEQQLREILGHFDHLYGRLERLEQEYHAITQGLRRIETLLVDEKTKREIIERSVHELKYQVAALQARLDDLERRIHE